MNQVKASFVITFNEELYQKAKAYVDDMKRVRKRVYWVGKEGKSDEELIIEQIAHRVLSGFYHHDPISSSRYIIRMDSQAQLSDLDNSN